MDSVVDHFGNAEVAQKNGKKFAGNIERQSIYAKNMEEGGPTRFLLNIDDIHQEGLKQRGESAGNHDIAGAPDALVEGQAIREQVTTDDEDSTHDEEGDDFIRDGLFLANESTTIEAKQHMGHRRDSA